MGALKALTGPIAAVAAEVAAVCLAILLLVAHVQLSVTRGELAAKTRALAALQGAVQFQNLAVEDWQAKATAARKAAQSAQEASRLAHAGDDARVAAVLAVPVENDATKACVAADAAIIDWAAK